MPRRAVAAWHLGLALGAAILIASTAANPLGAQPKPEAVQPPGGSPRPRPLPLDDVQHLWGYWSGDHFFYPGQIAQAEGERLLFRFSDGESAWLTTDEIMNYPLEVGMPVHANWQRRGGYYQAEIVSLTTDSVRLRYLDGVVENTSRAYLRLALQPWGMFTPGRRVLARWDRDGYWYPGTIEQVEAERRLVRFDDRQTAWLGRDGIALIQLYRRLRIEANAYGRGRYYPATVQSVRGNQVQVLYDDGDTETVSVAAIRRKMSLRGQ